MMQGLYISDHKLVHYFTRIHGQYFILTVSEDLFKEYMSGESPGSLSTCGEAVLNAVCL